MKVFQFFFNRIYRLFLKINGKNENPHITSWIYITFLFYSVSVIVIEYIPKIKALFIGSDRIFYLILFLLIALLFYFLLLYDKRYLNIVNKFEIETTTSKIIGNILVVSFPVLIFFWLLSSIF
jgi:hypothetical protein